MNQGRRVGKAASNHILHTYSRQMPAAASNALLRVTKKAFAKEIEPERGGRINHDKSASPVTGDVVLLEQKNT